MEVKRVMVPKDKLITSESHISVIEAMTLMVQNNVGSLIITENNEDAQGIVTSEDLMKSVVEKGEEGLDKKIGDLMSTDLITVKETEQLNLAIQKLEIVKKHHLIVVDTKGRLTGILSSYDIVRERALDIHSHPWIRH